MMQKIRQIIAAIVFVLSTLYICGISGFLPEWLNPKILVEIQLIPAILSASFVTVIALIALTFIIGRVYCSAICPLGIFQDLVMRLSKWIKKKRKIKRAKPHYAQANNVLRYSILLLTALFLLFGSTYLVLLLDPYSIFGRFSAAILTPIITFVNNIFASVGNTAGNYTFNFKEYHLPTFAVLSTVILTIGTIVYLDIKYNRLWCNTLCPVGTALGLASRFSLFRITINNDKCVDCKACARTCKSNVIDHLNDYKVDHSRCVSCFNCIDSCKKDALSLSVIKKRATND